MAKKKKTKPKKKPAKAAKKKKKAPAKKAKAKPAKKKKTSAKKAPAKKRAPSSVDGVLKKFEKERNTQQNKLSVLQKKITDLETKTRAFEEQIAKLKLQESETQQSIDQLDARRDEEVGGLLSQLGVKLGSDSAAPEPYSPPEPEPVVEEPVDESDTDESDDAEESSDAEEAAEPDSDDAGEEGSDGAAEDE